MTRVALSSQNPKVVRLGRLSARRRARESEDAIVVDGPLLVREALLCGVDVHEVFVDVERSGDDLDELVDLAENTGAHVYGVAPAVMRRVTDPVHPQAVVAVARRPVADPSVLAMADKLLVLMGVADPGNAGTLVRAAAGAGFDAVGFTEGTVELFAPKALRASAGACFRIPVVELGAPSGLLERLAGQGWTTVATSSHDGVPYDEVDLMARCAIVLGNEAHGVDDSALRAAEVIAAIPMAGSIESLNVAMAGTLLCFEVSRQRRIADRAAGSASSTVDPA